MRRSLVLLASLALLAGCGTMIDKPYQEVTVVTPDVEGADCILSTETQEYRIITPGSTMVERSPRKMTVTCEKAHYFDATVKVDSRLHMGWGALNVLNGVVPGAAYDTASGAIYAYPDEIVLDMVPDLEAMAAAKAAYTDVVPEVRKKEAPVFEETTPITPKGDSAFDKTLTK